MGVLRATLATATNVWCSCSLLLFAAGVEHPCFSDRQCAVQLSTELTLSPNACPWLSTRWHSVWAQMHELQLKQTCLPYYPPLQPISSGLQRTSSESVWQDQDQLLHASPLHRFWSQMVPTAQGFLLNLNAGGCLSAL